MLTILRDPRNPTRCLHRCIPDREGVIAPSRLFFLQPSLLQLSSWNVGDLDCSDRGMITPAPREKGNSCRPLYALEIRRSAGLNTT